MMLAVSAHLINKGMIPYSMAEWRFALLLSLLILSILAFHLSNQYRDEAIIVALYSAVPWFIWCAGTLLYTYLQWDITAPPIDYFLYAAYVTYGISILAGGFYLAVNLSSYK
ncbi:hypothetical protein [Sphingomonas sp.]|uniref:hypothetical protein n=1 Tax=Sphingomonas sp. TaxID=28214 RepID=UPI002579ED0E|nr:hypothetical protein [Sphingomonas sp.]